MIKAIILTRITLFWSTVCVVCSLDIQQSPKHLLQTVEKKEAKLSCQHGDANYQNLYWYQQKTNSGSLDLIGMLTYGSASPEDKFKSRFTLSGHATKDAFLLISSISAEDSAVYFCAAWDRAGSNPAYFGKGTKLTVLDSKVSERDDIRVRIIQPSDNEACKKKKVTLVCVAENFYPDHVNITWKVAGKERTDGVATDTDAIKDGTGNFTISSRLKVPKKEWNNPKNEFSCTLNFYNGTENFAITNENKVFGIGGGGYTREDYVKSSQVVILSYGVVIAKSGLYGLVIFVFVWRKGSHGK